MLHYASGAPSNDDFQVVENQLCHQRLFSVHPNHFSPVVRWLEDLHAGIFTFHDQIQEAPSLRDKLAREDQEMREELRIRGRDPEDWVPYQDALVALSDRLGPNYPRRIMLDSGAFTDWQNGYRSTVEDVVRRYRRFLELAGDLFSEVYLINLDVIPGERAKKGQEPREPTEREKAEAIAVSDENFIRLKGEFDEPILPVFHQQDAQSRIWEVVDMADGYICMSPNNREKERKRVKWTWLNVLAAGVRCHGLATTGNEMMQISNLYSGDSTSWRTHGGNGTIDVRWDEAKTADDLEGPIITPYYQTIHVAIERNEHDGKRLLPNNAGHISERPNHVREHVKARAERYLPFPMVQLDRNAMRIVSLGEIQSVAEKDAV